MFDIYARSFQEATRFSPYTRPDPRTLRVIDTETAKRKPRQRFWWHFLGLF